jgi:VIT1/CCC1 family predicted Fe2+/Mn2+ transporter
MELGEIYEGRGLKPDTALEVARQLPEHDALLAHARDELGISDLTQANPLEAALASAAAFLVGGALPVLVSLFFPFVYMVPGQYVFAIIALGLLGYTAAYVGGTSVWRPVARITFWGTAAMGLTAIVGYLFGVNI